MSLFKILKGDSSRISTDVTPFHDGWCYYTSDDGGFYIDANDNGVEKRTRINKAELRSGQYYGTCATASGTAAKVVTCADFELKTGVSVAVKFTSSNSAANPTLNVNGTGAKSIKKYGTAAPDAYMWQAGAAVDFVYDGANWIMNHGTTATTTYYGMTKLNSSTSSTSTTEAATPSAVKQAYDKAAAAVPSARTVNGKALSADISLSAADVGARPSTWTPTAADVGAAPVSHTHSYLPLTGGTLTGNLTLKGSGNYGTKINLGDGDYVHISEPTDDCLEIKAKKLDLVLSDTSTAKLTVNGTDLLTAIGAAASGHTHNYASASHTHTASDVGAVPTSRKVNGKALSADISLSAADVGAASSSHTHTASQVGLGNVPNVSTNDQTPTYTQASTLAALSSGEKLSVALGKIAKAVADLVSHIANKSNPHGVTAAQVGARPNTWTPTAADVGAAAAGHTHTATDVGAVPATRKINNKALSADISLSAADVGARPSTWTPTAAQVGAVPTTRTINGKALSSNVSLTASDVGAAAKTYVKTFTASDWKNKTITIPATEHGQSLANGVVMSNVYMLSNGAYSAQRFAAMDTEVSVSADKSIVLSYDGTGYAGKVILIG